MIKCGLEDGDAQDRGEWRTMVHISWPGIILGQVRTRSTQVNEIDSGNVQFNWPKLF